MAQIETTVPNWTVPPYQSDSASGGLTTMTDISPGIVFVAMAPCRVFDTRGAVGSYGGPRLVANTIRTFDIDNGPCTGIPAEVEAYSMNFGAILPDGANSFVTIWPTGSAQPLVSSINPILGGVVANAAIVPAGTAGSISVFPNTGLHLYGDINGYFTDGLNVANQVVILANVGNDSALRVDNASSLNGSRAILGNASAATGITWGVLGHTNSSTIGAAGVRGVALESNANGVQGVNLGSGIGVFGEGLGGAGVWGRTRSLYGVLGELRNDSNNLVVYGVLGLGGGSPEGENYGVYSWGPAHVNGTFTATTKNFVQPHPSDPSKEIRYVSLEGPQSEIYFRGSAQISQGVTRIPIPDYFRMVATPDSYSALVTPVGAMATVAVLSKGGEGITVQASRDVKIDYVVYAEREAVKQQNPVIENVHFRPDPNLDLLAHLPESYRQLMIQNGTLNADGTVNRETAKRLGWDKLWEKRSRPAAQPSAP